PKDSRDFVMTKIVEDIDFAIAKIPLRKSIDRITHWSALALKSRICLFEGTFRKYHGLDGWNNYLSNCVVASEELIDSGQYGIYKDGDNAYRNLFSSIDAIAEEVILARDYSKDLKICHDANYYIRGTTSGRPGMNKKIVDSYLMSDGT
ncbi:MAG: RagB/SusD family nutrient uptake outer membrane protein, partial [Bacteroidaceae bacterium]